MSRDIHTLLIPDQILPSQLMRRPAWTPEQRLLHACLMDAIEQLHKHNHRYRLSLTSYNAYKEAYDWVHDDTQDYLFSFRRVCDELSLSASAVRTALDAEFAPPQPKCPKQKLRWDAKTPKGHQK